MELCKSVCIYRVVNMIGKCSVNLLEFLMYTIVSSMNRDGTVSVPRVAKAPTAAIPSQQECYSSDSLFLPLNNFVQVTLSHASHNNRVGYKIFYWAKINNFIELAISKFTHCPQHKEKIPFS